MTLKPQSFSMASRAESQLAAVRRISASRCSAMTTQRVCKKLSYVKIRALQDISTGYFLIHRCGDKLVSGDPVLIAYAVKRRRNGKGVNYTPIGRAYPHNTGDGLTVILDALPLKGYHFVLLELDEQTTGG